MKEFLELILEPMKDVYAKFKEFAPNLLAMMTIILVGILFARIMKAVLLRFMRAIKFDTWSDRMGLTVVMRKSDLWSKPSEAVGSIVFWVLIIGSLMAGLSSLRIHAIDNLVASFVLYLPRAFSAVFILVFGYIIAGFIGRAVLIAAVNSGYHYAKLLAEAVRLLLTVLILAMALEQLQVAPGIVVAAFSIIFGGIVLALAISFGVGGIDAARKMIEKEDESKEEKKDIQHM
jgi:Mechanosensitive ion channel, conserved TM helix